MPNKSNRYIVSLGGSLIVPHEIDVDFIKQFKQLIEAEVKKGKKFILIVGGGKTSRFYTDAAKSIIKLSPDDLDWLGIHATRLNAHLLRTIFRKISHLEIITNPYQKLPAKEPLIIAAGYHPGNSTDNQAVLLAKLYGATTVLNLSNIDYVYDKDPKKYKNAKEIKSISWKNFRKLVGDKWDPGSNSPFDPVASKLAQKLKLKVIVMNGNKLENLKNFLDGKNFVGTVIE